MPMPEDGGGGAREPGPDETHGETRVLTTWRPAQARAAAAAGTCVQRWPPWNPPVLSAQLPRSLCPPDQSQTFLKNILIASFREPQRRACPRLSSEVRDGRVRGSQGPCPAASTMLETALEVIPRERFRLVKGRRPHVPLITAMSPPLLWEMRWRQHFGCRNPIFRGS